jgi:hypothetical protein
MHIHTISCVGPINYLTTVVQYGHLITREASMDSRRLKQIAKRNEHAANLVLLHAQWLTATSRADPGSQGKSFDRRLSCEGSSGLASLGSKEHALVSLQCRVRAFISPKTASHRQTNPSERPTRYSSRLAYFDSRSISLALLRMWRHRPWKRPRAPSIPNVI